MTDLNKLKRLAEKAVDLCENKDSDDDITDLAIENFECAAGPYVFLELIKDNERLVSIEATAFAEAANRRLLAQSALDYIAGKIDANKLVELAQGMLK